MNYSRKRILQRTDNQLLIVKDCYTLQHFFSQTNRCHSLIDEYIINIQNKMSYDCLDELDNDYGLNQQIVLFSSANKELAETFDYSSPISEIDHFLEDSPSIRDFNPDIVESYQIQSASQSEQIQQIAPLARKKNKNSMKNSNAIKKMGRIILGNLSEYRIHGPNLGVERMLQLLESRFAAGKSKSIVDGFNTHHLSALFDSPSDEEVRFNLQTTRRLFSKLARKEVLQSFQIKGQAKLLYLNTLKCSSIRFMSKMLAGRLQTSENQN